MKLLIAIDLSASSELVLGEVESRPWPASTAAVVLHVVDLFTIPPGLGSLGAIAEDERRRAEAVAGAAAERLAQRGIEAAAEVIEGYPPTSIVEFADRCGADFVILGSHGHGLWTRFLLGSVAQAVVREARCSVEIVRRRRHPDPAAPLRILLASDGSAWSLAAARSLAGLRWSEEVEIKILSVAEAPIPLKEAWHGGPDAIARLREERLEQAREAVRSAEQVLAAKNLKTTGAVIAGSPKAVILDEAKAGNSDLIVVGSHGRRGVPRILMGSVSEAVALHADCSVAVIRERRS